MSFANPVASDPSQTLDGPASDPDSGHAGLIPGGHYAPMTGIQPS